MISRVTKYKYKHKYKYIYKYKAAREPRGFHIHMFLLKGNHKRLLLVTSGYLGYLLQTDPVFLHTQHVQKHPIYCPTGRAERGEAQGSANHCHSWVDDIKTPMEQSTGGFYL